MLVSIPVQIYLYTQTKGRKQNKQLSLICLLLELEYPRAGVFSIPPLTYPFSIIDVIHVPPPFSDNLKNLRIILGCLNP